MRAENSKPVQQTDRFELDGIDVDNIDLDATYYLTPDGMRYVIQCLREQNCTGATPEQDGSGDDADGEIE